MAATLLIAMAASVSLHAAASNDTAKGAKAADVYEPDNTPEQAVVDRYSSNTQHNFFDQDDEDWLLFWVEAPDWVTFVETSTIGVNCDPKVEIYQQNGDGTVTLIRTLDTPGDERLENAPGEYGDFFTQSGYYYLRVTNSLGLYGDQTDYDINISGASGGLLASLGGVVTASDNQSAIANATVTVQRLGFATAPSDGNGVYNFAALPKENGYTVTASAAGFFDDAQLVDLTTGISTLDFTLTRIPKAALAVDPLEVDVGATGSTTSFSVSNTGDAALNWTAAITSGSDWISFASASSGTDNATVDVNYSTNPAEAQRTATIEFSDPDADNSPQTVTIRQAPNTTPTLDVQPATQNVGFAAGSTSFTVSNPGFGTLTFAAEVIQGAEWLSLGAKGAGGGIITANFTANPTDVQRTGTIRVTASGADNSPLDVSVVQAPNTTPELAVTPANQNVGSQAGNVNFTVSNAGFGNLDWSVAVTAGAEWLSAASAKVGGGGGTIVAQYAANPAGSQRIGTITVTAPGALGSPKDVTVTQEANTTPVLSVTPTQRNVSSSSGTTSFDIANAGFGTLNWTAEIASGSEWLSFVGKVDGSGNASIQVAFAQNTIDVQRSATIEISAQGAVNSPQQVTVLQAADATPALEVQPRSREVPADASQTTFAVTNTGHGTLNWTAEVLSGPEWVLLSTKANGSNDGTLIVDCAANDTNSSRLAICRISAPGVAGSPIDVTILQAKPASTPTDLNGDSVVDAVDVQLVINAALETGSTSGDVDGDGDVDAVDVQLVINAALGL